MTQSNPDGMTITLSPNRSATMRQTRIVIVLIGSFVFIIGLGWAWMGAYLVLPFAGLEVGLLAYFMQKVCYSTYEKEVISIQKEQVIIHSGLHSIEHTLSMERSKTHVVVSDAEHPTQPIELNLTDSKLRFELGSFLNQADKLTARMALKNAGLTEFNNKWWLSTPR
ncbi:MAG: DUF2244 domain-containing protein [Thiotrichaceae bacterium]